MPFLVLCLVLMEKHSQVQVMTIRSDYGMPIQEIIDAFSQHIKVVSSALRFILVEGYSQVGVGITQSDYGTQKLVSLNRFSQDIQMP